MTIDSITLDPPMRDWPALLQKHPKGQTLGRSLEEWRRIAREGCNLVENHPVIATGHQPALWHPGILAKYIAAEEFGRRLQSGNVLDVTVSQDIVAPGLIDVPGRRPDGELAVRTIDFAERPAGAERRVDVPIVAWPAFAVRRLELGVEDLLPSVREGLERIHAALSAGADQRNAAAQMMVALRRLMSECVGVGLMERTMGSTLLSGEYGLAILRAMAADPQRCATCYNAAVAAVPQARLASLAVRNDLVELPLWRLSDDGRRLRAYDSDVEAAIAEYGIPSRQQRERLMPRALLMTAMLRLAVCDLFIHGAGGEIYDRAMERWIGEWLNVEVAPMATVSATVHLPLMAEADLARVNSGGLDLARHRARRWMHDPESADVQQRRPHHPGAGKQALLREIDALPRRSPERRRAFLEMHQRLGSMRRESASQVDYAQRELAHMERLSQEAETAMRRDWAFPLYPRETLADLAARIRDS